MTVFSMKHDSRGFEARRLMEGGSTMINDRFLDEAREVPSTTPMERVVAWSVFRSRADARKLLEHVYLAPGQGLVGGYGRDSVAPYWWVGVQVQDVSQWGNVTAVHKHGRLGD